MSNLQDINVLNFELSDCALAVELWATMDGVTLNESDTPEAISTFLARNPQMSFIAKNSNGRVIGTILCGHNGRAGHIYHLAVEESFRGKGLGRHLVELCFARLAAEKIPRCNIFVYPNNDVGNSFWLGTGWNDPATWKVLQKHVET